MMSSAARRRSRRPIPPVTPDEPAKSGRDTARIRLVISDDHELARSGLRAVIEGEADLQIVGEAADGIEAVELCRTESPDLALLDLRMPRLDGLGAARAIRACCPSTRILMVTLHASAAYIEQAVRAGASGYVLKDASRVALLAAVRAVANGDTVLDGVRAAARPTDGSGRPDGAAPSAVAAEALTPRETQVLGFVVQGLTNKQIAQRMAIAPGTVKVHVERLIGKLGVADRTQAAVRAVEHGLVSRPAR